jgi:hypothetical protein
MEVVLIIIPTVHGAKVGFRATREIVDSVGVGVKSSLLDGL